MNTSFGTHIGGNVNTNRGDFVGRDQYIYGDHAQGDKIVGNKIVYYGSVHPPLEYRSEITGIINFYTKVFVGRESEYERILHFAHSEQPGYLLIEASPGYGKSALVANFIHRAEVQKESYPFNIIYFFIREEGSRNTPISFLQSINSQLLSITNNEGGIPSDLYSLRNQFSQLWRSMVANAQHDKPLLLLVDALDEMAVTEASIANELPTLLGPYVHVIVTSRPNPKPLQQISIEHPFKNAETLRLHRLNITQTQMLLQTYNVASINLGETTKRIFRMTRGEPLFAKFVCQEVSEHGTVALSQLENNPPKDVEEYFRQNFARLDRFAADKLTWDILGVFIATLGGISLQDIAEVLNISPRGVRKAIEPIRRFLLGEEKLELMHLQLRKVVAGEFSDNEKIIYTNRIIQWCESYQKQGWQQSTSNYILYNFAKHLANEGRREDLYKLLTKDWMELKSNRTFSHRSFGEDLELAISVALAETPVNWISLARNTLIYSFLISISGSVAPESLGFLSYLGQSSRALGYLALIHDKRKLYLAYRLILDGLTANNEFEQIAAIIYDLQRLLEGTNDFETKVMLNCNLAYALIAVGDVTESINQIKIVLKLIKTTDQNQLLFRYDPIIYDICYMLINVGEFDLVFEITAQVPDDKLDDNTDLIAFSLSDFFNSTGVVDIGRSLSGEIILDDFEYTSTSNKKPHLLRTLSLLLVRAKKPELAIKLAQDISDLSLKLDTLLNISDILDGQFDKSKALYPRFV